MFRNKSCGEILGMIAALVVVYVVFLFLLAFPVMWLGNFIVTELGYAEFSYNFWFAILAVCSILFRSGSSSK